MTFVIYHLRVPSSNLVVGAVLNNHAKRLQDLDKERNDNILKFAPKLKSVQANKQSLFLRILS
jgi:uncharacterized protein YciI